MTVEQYAQEHSLSPETVRRYIRLGKLKAHRVGRRYEIETYDTIHDTIHDNILQLLNEKDERIKQLTQQNERLTHLIAMQTRQNTQLLSQLPAPRSTAHGVIERITRLFAKLRAKQA